MHRGTGITIFLLLLLGFIVSLLSIGCGGGGLPSSQQSNLGAQATSQSLQAPMLGFVYAPAGGELRAIVGVPGASILSHPLALPSGVTNLYFAPGQRYAIAAEASDASISVLTFPTANPGPLVEITGAISQPDIVSFSPNGTTALVYSSSESRLEVISGLPGKPIVAREVASDELPSALRWLALGDDGVTLLAGTANNMVYRVAAGGAPVLLDTVGDLEGMAFVPKSEDAVIFDRNAGSLSLLQSVNSVPTNRSLVDGLTGLGGNIGLQVAAGKALLTSSSNNHLWQIDLQSFQVQILQLPAAATMLEPLRTAGRYLLSWQSSQPAWIVDTSGQAGTVYFVPASVDAGANP